MHIATCLITRTGRADFGFSQAQVNVIRICFLFQDTLYIRVPKRGGIEEKHFEPLSVAFLVFFAMIILMQFISMLFHRYGTFLHILASTTLHCCRLVNVNRWCHAKRALMAWIVVIPKEGWAHVWHWLLGRKNPKNQSKKSVSYQNKDGRGHVRPRVPILLLVWQRLRP